MTYPNWFVDGGAQDEFERHLLPRSTSIRHCLQIGAFTGDGSLWMMEHLPDALLIDVDTWHGSDEEAHAPFDWNDVERTYDAKLSPHGHRIRKCRGTSDEFFGGNTESFDFIYIDGAHTAKQVMRDALNATECIRPGGIIAFDDYAWGLRLPVAERPRVAVDAFLQIFHDHLDLLANGLQAWVRWR